MQPRLPHPSPHGRETIRVHLLQQTVQPTKQLEVTHDYTHQLDQDGGSAALMRCLSDTQPWCRDCWHSNHHVWFVG
ncbi:hypothetical protein DPMN_091409 [Dreissena polymorpha]|uniref:Uncharacterized protein n=1 Tax=Dreissena polymorpha TaxID=45954 RepID=A0A9D4L0H3_DREPO|nr:hypothetical protein DPMN_091409 [Dreissena polymorpha]